MFNSNSVEEIIESALHKKLENYSPEPSHKPFHTRLLGRDRMVLYSFIHYNPYEPEPYKRWTLRRMLEIENQSQLIVGKEFWNFLAGGEEIYQDLLDCFEKVGSKMRYEIDRHFKLLGDVRYK